MQIWPLIDRLARDADPDISGQAMSKLLLWNAEKAEEIYNEP